MVHRTADALPPRPGGLTRRNLLERCVGPWISTAALAGMSTRSILEAASAQAADSPDATILVSLSLDGGNDGLNSLVPVGDAFETQEDATSARR